MSDLTPKKPQHEDVQLAQNKSECWYDARKKKYIPFSEMSNTDLKRARHLSQMREVDYFNKAGFWGSLADKLEAEGSKRGLVMKDLNTKYHKTTRHFKDVNAGRKPNADGVLLK